MTTIKKEEKKGGPKLLGLRHSPRGFNPFTDWSFKRLFANESNKDLLIAFLNLLLDGDETVEDLEYINKESTPRNEDERICVFDVLCTDKNGTKFLVEMQKGKLPYINNRIVYYTCRLIDEMGEKGDAWMYDLKKVYSVCIMDFECNDGNDEFRQDIKLCNIKTSKEFSDRIHIIMLQLPLLKWRTLSECRKNYEKYLYLLKIIKEGMKDIEALKAEIDATPMTDYMRMIFKKVLDTTNVESLTGQEKIDYERDLKHYRDYMGTMYCAKEEGRAEGMAEGKAEGEKEKAVSIAKSMKLHGLSAIVISQCTGLSEEEIEKL